MPVHAVLHRKCQRRSELVRRLELECCAHEGLLRFGVYLGNLQRQRKVNHGDGGFRKIVALAVHKQARGCGSNLIPVLLCAKAGVEYIFRAYLSGYGCRKCIPCWAGHFLDRVCPGRQIADDHLSLVVYGEGSGRRSVHIIP